ncbi:MAG: class A beta-lactamase [Muribaculaceae bacterium]|nr:class A beta-lactamase [Muribaculaceae bacterium]
MQFNKRIIPRWMAILTAVGSTLLTFFIGSCTHNVQTPKSQDALSSTLNSLVSKASGCVGIAMVSKSDTITINNGVHYPMMSVFKLHQALAVADKLERTDTPLDTTILVSASELDKDTWSPMLKEYRNEDFSISVANLIKYTLVSSDNNASNILFKRFVSPLETDKFVKTVATDTTFRITFSEALMKSNPELSYNNYTSPLSASLLIKQVFTDSLLSSANQDSIQSYLTSVTTGHDRLGAAVEGEEGVIFGHKTGSGYRNNRGELIAHNDVGYFRLPDGRDYSLAVFIRDFNGTEEEASALIASISRCVYDYFRK